MVQTIPLIYTEMKDRKLYCGDATYSDGKIEVKSNVPAVTLSCLKNKSVRNKIIVVDCVGLNRNDFNGPFVEFCRLQGNDIWLIEPVYDDDDVLDAFLGAADKLVFPYTGIRSDKVLNDILAISDDCIPLVTCANGKCNGRSPLDIVTMLAETGFHNVMVADMDGTITDDQWRLLNDECGGLIAYSPFRRPLEGPSIIAEDVLDAFLGAADKLVFPYTGIRSDKVLNDILAISDDCIPLVTCANGKCNGRSPINIVSMLAETGFHNVMVADMNGTITDDQWRLLNDECGGLIAYSPFRRPLEGPSIIAEDVCTLNRF